MGGRVREGEMMFSLQNNDFMMLCTYIHIYIYTYIYTYVYVRIWIRTYIHTYTHVCTYKCVCTFVHSFLSVLLRLGDVPYNADIKLILKLSKARYECG